MLRRVFAERKGRGLGGVSGVKRIAALAILVTPITVSHPVHADAIDDLKRDQPPDVAAYIDRRAGCNYWASEAPFDSERAADIKKAMGELKCSSLAGDEKQLRAFYAKSSVRVLKVLDEARDLTY